MQANPEFVLDITPDVTLLSKLGRSSFTFLFALGEFIDNAYDARENLDSISINIDFDLGQQFIIISDTGTGMNAGELEMALKVGLSRKRPDSIGIYGFGLKAAATYLSRRFQIETAKLGSNEVLRLVYDQEKFEAAGKWELSAVAIPKSDHTIDHGTRITLTRLNVDISNLSEDEIRSKLASLYHKLIRQGKLNILVGSKPVEPPTYDLVPNIKWEIDLTLNGKQVKGWVGAQIPIKISGKKRLDFEPGFQLLRHGRVLRTGEWIGVKRHDAVRTLIGELELDEFEMNNNKTDFLRDTPDWVALEKAMRDFFNANNIRQKIYQGTKLNTKLNKKIMTIKPPVTAPDTPTTTTTGIPASQYHPPNTIEQPKQSNTQAIQPTDTLEVPGKNKNIFIVHGLDHAHRKECVQVLKSLGLNPIVLQEQPNQGKTIIEKFEHAAKQCQYAIILLTPDDMAYSPLKGENVTDAKPRARQNVVFEFGYFVGKILRKRTTCVYKDGSGLELPTDLSGVVYIPFKNSVKEAREALKKELIQSGLLD
jgi:predicted nucleotide-binding protein